MRSLKQFLKNIQPVLFCTVLLSAGSAFSQQLPAPPGAPRLPSIGSSADSDGPSQSQQKGMNQLAEAVKETLNFPSAKTPPHEMAKQLMVAHSKVQVAIDCLAKSYGIATAKKIEPASNPLNPANRINDYKNPTDLLNDTNSFINPESHSSNNCN